MGSVTAQNKFRADPPEAEQRLELAAGLEGRERVDRPWKNDEDGEDNDY